MVDERVGGAAAGCARAGRTIRDHCRLANGVARRDDIADAHVGHEDLDRSGRRRDGDTVEAVGRIDPDVVTLERGWSGGGRRLHGRRTLARTRTRAAVAAPRSVRASIGFDGRPEPGQRGYGEPDRPGRAVTQEPIDTSAASDANRPAERRRFTVTEPRRAATRARTKGGPTVPTGATVDRAGPGVRGAAPARA